MRTHSTHRIGLLAYEGCMGVEIFGVCDLLLVAQHVAQAQGKNQAIGIEVCVLSLGKRSVRTAGGIRIQGMQPRGKFDWLIVPGPEVVRSAQWPQTLARLGPELGFIQRSFARGSRVASVCVGSFLLAEAGLLDDRQATTAWIMAKEFAALYPQVRLDPRAILLEDGAVVTSGAITSSFDLGLHLIKRVFGADVASATARIALLPKPRSSQAPYVDAQLLQAPAGEPRSFSTSIAQWLQKRIEERYDLSRLASAFHVSPRTLMRRVKAETGLSPLGLLQEARVNRAKHLLSTSSMGIAQIVQAVGYSDVATFSRLFAKSVGESPAKYRARSA